MSNITLKMLLDNSDFKKEMDNSKKTVGDLDKEGGKLQSGRMSKGMKAVRAGAIGLAAGFVAVTAAVGVLVRRQLEHIDTQAKLADKYNISMEAIGAFEHIANLTGTSTDNLGKAVQELTLRMGRADEGAGKTEEALGLLGYTIDEIKEMDADQQFYELAGALNGVEDATQQAYIANELFGRQGRELLGVIRSSGGELSDMANEASRLGLTMSREAAASVEQFNDSMTRLQAQGTASIRNITVELAPALNNLAIAFSNAGEGAGFLKTALDFMTRTISGTINALATLINMTNAQGRATNVQMGIADSLNDMYNNITDTYGSYDEAVRQSNEGVQEAQSLVGGYAIVLDGIIETHGEASEAVTAHRLATGQLTEEISESQAQMERPVIMPPLTAPNTSEVKATAAETDALARSVYASMANYTGNFVRSSTLALESNFMEVSNGLKEMRQLEIISQEEFNQYMLEMQEQHNQNLAEIEDLALINYYENEEQKTRAHEKAIRARVGMESQGYKHAADIAGMGSQLMGHENKQLHRIGQISALAQSKMFIAEAIARSLTMGPIAGPAYASLATAVGGTQIATIAATKPPPSAKKNSLKLPSFDQGAYEVPGDMVANIHKGETILPKPFAQDFRAKTEGKGNTSNSNVYNINVAGSVIDERGFLKSVGNSLRSIESRTGQKNTRSVY